MSDFQRLLLDYYSDGLSIHEKRVLRGRQRQQLRKLYDQRPTAAEIFNAAMEPGGDANNDS